MFRGGQEGQKEEKILDRLKICQGQPFGGIIVKMDSGKRRVDQSTTGQRQMFGGTVVKKGSRNS